REPGSCRLGLPLARAALALEEHEEIFPPPHDVRVVLALERASEERDREPEALARSAGELDVERVGAGQGGRVGERVARVELEALHGLPRAGQVLPAHAPGG